MKIYIINPDNGQLVAPKDWRNEENPTRANFVVIENNDGTRFMMSKSLLCEKKRMTFDEAQKEAAGFSLDGFDGFTCGNIDQWLSTYEARYIQGEDDLDEVLTLIGGDNLMCWHWTERAFQSLSYNAWVFDGYNGAVAYTYRVCAYCARVFRAF